MWSSDRLSRRWVLGALTALSGCGLEPVYGPGAAANDLFGRIALTAPDSVEGYRLRSRIERRLGRAEAADLTLDVALDITRERVAVAEDGSITRFTLPGAATWVLRDTAGVTVADGTVNAFASYSTTGTTVATRAAETDARARLAVILADLIVTRLIARL